MNNIQTEKSKNGVWLKQKPIPPHWGMWDFIDRVDIPGPNVFVDVTELDILTTPTCHTRQTRYLCDNSLALHHQKYRFQTILIQGHDGSNCHCDKASGLGTGLFQKRLVETEQPENKLISRLYCHECKENAKKPDKGRGKSGAGGRGGGKGGGGGGKAGGVFGGGTLSGRMQKELEKGAKGWHNRGGRIS